MASGFAPIISTSLPFQRAVFVQCHRVFNAVWPPSVGSKTSLPFAPKAFHFLLFADDDFLHAFGVIGSM